MSDIKDPPLELLRELTALRQRVAQLEAAAAERQQLEAELQRTHDWFTSLLTTTQDAFLSIDRQGRIVHFNPAAERIFGYTAAEVHDQDLRILMPELYASEHASYIAHYERTGEARAIGRIRSVSAKRKNGEIFPIELSVTEVALDENVHYGAFIRDISERVRLQERLLERERLAAMGTAAAKLGHEIGNPLNSIFVTAQLLERQLARQRDGDKAKTQERLRNLRHEITRLNTLLHEFRTFSRRPQLRLRPTSLALVVQDLLRADTLPDTAPRIRMEVTLPPDLPQVMAGGDKLKQVLLNLCKNAVEAMPQGGRLTVRAHNSG